MFNKKIENCWLAASSSLVNLPATYEHTVCSNLMNMLDMTCLCGTACIIYVFGNINFEKAEKFAAYMQESFNNETFFKQKLDKHDFVMAFSGRILHYYQLYKDNGGIITNNDFDLDRLSGKTLDHLSSCYLKEIKFNDNNSYYLKQITSLIQKAVLDCKNRCSTLYNNINYSSEEVNSLKSENKPEFKDVLYSYDDAVKQNKNEIFFEFNGIDEFMKYSLIVSERRKNGVDIKVIWKKGNEYIKLQNEGAMLFEQKKHKEALLKLEKSLEINPIGLASRFEIVSNYLAIDELENAKHTLVNMKDLLITNSDVAAFYRQFGAISFQEEKYDLSYACYFYSKKYELSKIANNEIIYLSLNYQISKFLLDYYVNFDFESTAEYLKCNNIPLIDKKEKSINEKSGKENNNKTKIVDARDYEDFNQYINIDEHKYN